MRVSFLSSLIVLTLEPTLATMASIVDSEAQFETRLRELGCGDRELNAIQAHGARTLSHLANALGQPNQTISNDEVSAFLQSAFSRSPTIQELGSIMQEIDSARH